jgi:uncharacterized membrane protein YccC
LSLELAMSNAPIPRKSLRANVQEHRAQLGLAVRVTIAAVLAFALSHLVFVPLPLWTVLTAVILADSDEAARLKRDDCAQGFLDDAAPL